MNYLRFAAFGLVCSAAPVLAQTATLTANTTDLAAVGGQVMLTASVSYDGEPGAVGWSIQLPADWTLESVSGPNLPAVAPDAGTSGTLEFAYVSVPPYRAEFSIIVRYPAGAKSGVATPTVLLRAAGKLTTLKPQPVQLGAPAPRS